MDQIKVFELLIIGYKTCFRQRKSKFKDTSSGLLTISKSFILKCFVLKAQEHESHFS